MASESPDSLFSAGQRRLVAFAVSFVALLAIGAGIFGAIFLLGELVSFFSGVLWPLAVAAVLAVVLRPLVSMLETRIRGGRVAAVITLYVIFLLVASALLTQLVPLLVSQVVDLFTYLQSDELEENFRTFLSSHLPGWTEFAREQLNNPTVQRLLDSLLSEGQSLSSRLLPSLRAAGGGVLGAFATVTQAVVVPVYLFFFLLSRGEPTANLPNHLTFLHSGPREDVVFLLREFVAIVESFFRGQLIIGLVMGCLLALGFSVVGLKFGLFIGLCLGLLNIIPYLGTTIGLAVALPLAFFQDGGSWKLVGLVLLVVIIVQSIEGWFLTPKIMGNRTGLHPVMIIFALFFWGTVFGGILGMVLAIPLTAFVVTAWRLAQRKYFRGTNPPMPAA